MINPRTALTRIAQEFFHQHLIALYRWDEVEYEPPERVENIVLTRSERRAMAKRGITVPEPLDGKYREVIRMGFGPYNLMLKSSVEAPPCGIAVLSTGDNKIEGPLDAKTWQEFADFIHERQNHGCATPTY